MSKNHGDIQGRESKQTEEKTPELEAEKEVGGSRTDENSRFNENLGTGTPGRKRRTTGSPEIMDDKQMAAFAKERVSSGMTAKLNEVGEAESKLADLLEQIKKAEGEENQEALEREITNIRRNIEEN